MAIVDVIKYNGNPDTFAWKYPSEELGTWTQLIVNESQEAILFKGGRALDVFESGRHTLDTANIPFLNKIINLPFGNRSPFTAEVWFVNKAYNLDVKWGTPTPIQVQDAKYGIFVPVRSNGAFGIQIEDSKKFLVKLVGTLPAFGKMDIIKYFRGLYITKVKDSISTYLIHKQISILEINAYLDELSEFMKKRMEPVLEEYGIKLATFYVNDISVPEEDPAVKQLKAALAKRAEMNIIGYNYQQERSFDTLEGAAKNAGSTAAPLMGAGMGLGMGLGMGHGVGGAFTEMTQGLRTDDGGTKECPRCHAVMTGNQRFCGMCGFDTDLEPEEEPAEAKCSSCGCIITKDVKFCPQCGRKINHCPECGNDLAEGAVQCSACGYEPKKACPGCGAAITAEMKFCPECGEALVKRCPKCGTAFEGSPKFCLECGEKL